MGDAILAVYDWPSQKLLGVDHNWPFSSLAYGAVLYGAFVGSHRLFRKRPPSASRLIVNRT
jgi:hypothetical protein